MLKKTTIVALALMSGLAFGQNWSAVKEDPNSSLSEIKQAFDSEWSGKTYEKGKGYKAFKRWYNFVEPRCYPKGNPNDAYRAPEEFQKYLAAHPELQLQMDAANAARINGGNNQVMSTTWTQVGPAGAVPGGGAGRINKVVLDPVTSTTMYACAPAGSLWKSTNSGTTWTVLTDNLPVIGCSDLAINPLNNQEMYLATGDADAGDNPSIGVYKSTNGGVTWVATALTFNASAGTRIRRLLIHPTNPQIVMCGSNAGFYRTTNGGTSWTQITTNSYRDMEFNPLNPNVIHAVSTSDYFRSSNAGLTWSNTGNGTNLSTTAGRFCIAVTPADTNYVYVLAGATGNGFLAFYRSTNSGTTFTSMTTTPNLLGWSSTGGDTGGQAFYDLCCAASPTNKDEVVTGGVNIWRTTNGGTSFSIYGHWTGSGAPYVHADIHDLIYTSAAVLYVGCDGGVFRRGASSYTDLSGNMSIAQPYAVGCSGSTQNLLITGHQDNGTNRWNGTAWAYAMGGDGMVAFIDKTNNNVMYGSQYSGSLNRSTNGGVNWTGITSGLPTGPWVTRWMHDPTTSSTLYSGFTQVYKSTNQGTNWAVTGTMAGSGDITSIDIAKSNTQIIYASRSNGLYKSINGGTAWTTITGTLPVGSAAITDIAIDPLDPNNAWVTFSGFASGTKVYVTTNGGTSWTNYSTGLPNIPVNTIVYQPGATNDAIYVGTDVGVYYRDNLQASWTSYMIGLPNVVVADLDFYAPTLKLRAATYGRGVWEVDANNPGNLPPVADFTSNRQVICPAMTVTFTDVSAFTPTSWSWVFQGGTPATSTAQNPTITYNTAGTYSVQLTATNINGSNAITKTTYITVTGINSLPLSEGFVSTTFPPTGWTTKDANTDGIFWTRNATVGYNSTNSMMFDNYNLDAAGSRDEMQTMKYNFSTYSSATLTFDVAYREYDATYSDTLAVMVSTDCGVTFTQAYMKGGSTLSTVAGTYTTAIFAPSGNPQWRSENVSLNAYAGQGNVMVVFQNRGRYGQALYVDNINITGTVSGAPPTANFTASTTKCVGQNIAFTDASTGAPTSWAWTFQGGTPATSTLQNPSSSFSTAGVHTATLVATNANGPSSPYIMTFTVVAIPTANAGLNKVITCTSPVAQLNGSGGGTYAWSGPSGYTSTLVQPTVLNPGTYTLVVTTTGCASTPATVTVTTNTVQPNASASTTSTITCSSSTGTVNASSTTPGATYVWSGTGIVSGGTTATATVNAGNTYSVTVTDPANGCVRTTTVTVTTNTVQPNASAASTSTITCLSTTGTVNASSTTPGATYAWTGTGIVSGAATATATVNAANTFTVTVTNPANGCVRTATVTVASNIVAPNVGSTSSSGITCASSTGTVTGSSTTPGATFNWTGPGVVSGATTTVATVNAVGTYTLTVTNPANGCTNTATAIVTSNTTPPNATSSTTSTLTCVNMTGTVNASSSTGGVTYSWSGPGIVSGGTTNSATVNAAGAYTVTVTNPSNGCTATSVVNVTSNTTAPAVATISQLGNVLTSSSATNNQWYFNGAIMPGETNQTLNVTQNGNYTVVVTDPSNGCTSTSVIFTVGSIGISVVGINGELNVYPNPNNGEFAIVLTLSEKSTIKIEIRNVLGQLVFDDEILNASGQITRNVNIGTYGSGNYILTVSNKNGKTVKKIVVQ